MTQNKKKGIAKKALSVSLVAAMLATSNVPAWASGFEAVDPAEGFAVEAAAPEAEAVENEPVVDFDDSVSTQAEDSEAGYNSTITLTDNGWGSPIGVSGEVWNGDAANGTRVNQFFYAWYVDGKQVYPAAGQNAYVNYSSNVTLVQYTPTYNDYGKTVSLRVWLNDGQDGLSGDSLFDFTTDSITVGAYDISGYSDSNFWMFDPDNADKAHAFANGTTVEYRGKNIQATPYVEPFTVGDETLTTKDFSVSYDTDGNYIDAGSTITVTLEPTDIHYSGKLQKTYTIGKANWNTFTNAVVREIKDDVSYEYTGSPIAVEFDDFIFMDAANNRNQDLKDAIVAVQITDGNFAEINNYTPAEDFYHTAIIVDPEKVANYDLSGAADVQYDGETFKLIGLTGTYSIVPRDLSKCTFVIDPLARKAGGVNDNDAGFVGKVHAFDASGNALNLVFDYTDKDFWINVDNNSGVGTFGATIEASNRGTTINEKDITFQVIAANFDNVEFSNMDKVREAVPYTGEPVTKDVSTFGTLQAIVGTLPNGTSVVDEKDYTVTFEGVDAGTGYVVVTGKNNFAGAVKKFPFEITPANVSDDTVSVAAKVVYNPVYTKASQYAPSVVVKAYNTAKPAKEFILEEGKDFTVSYSFTDGENGLDKRITSNIRITNPNFRGNEKRVVKTGATVISKKQFGDLNIVLNQSSYTYTGGVIIPDITITDGDDQLVEGIDYTISANGTNVGKYTATIRGKGTYDAAATTTVEYEITPADMKDVKVSIADVTYNGEMQKPTVDQMTFTLNGKRISTSQFKVAYPDPSQNVDAGKGLIRISSRTDNFEGSADTEFTIKPAVITGEIKVYDEDNTLVNVTPNTTFQYDGKEHTFAKVAFTPDSTNPLAKYVTDDDWEVKYIDNKYGTKAYVAIIAKNNFAGTQQITNAEGSVVSGIVDYKQFTVEKYEITKQHVTFGDAEYAGGVTVTPDIKVIIGNNVLKEGTDYIVECKTEVEPTNGKTLKVTVSGINGYTGSVTDYVAVVKKDIANCEIIVEGNNVTVMNGKVVVPSSEYTVSWADETVTVTAASDSKYYEGSQTVDRDIIAAPGNTVMSVSDRTTSTVTVNWEKVDDAEGYTIWYRSEYDTKMSRHIVKDNDTTSWTVKGLQPGTKYFFSARAWVQDDEGNYVFSEEQSPTQRGTTKPLAAKIIGVSVEKGKIKVRLAGEAAGAEMYSMCYGDARTSFADGDFKVGIRTQYTTRTLTPTFEPGTYYVCVKSYRDLGNNKRVYGAWSNTFRAVVK